MMDSEVPERLGRYIDLQVNGYAGVDFNCDSLTLEDLHIACLRLEADGVEGILATVITDRFERMSSRLSRLAQLLEMSPTARRIVWGVHIEGPFILKQPGFVGTHPAAEVRPADVDVMQRLLDAADGLTRIVTLAPECDPNMVVTKTLADQGICVAAGHCNPSLEQLDAAIDAGLAMFTHLGNGCPIELPRHDNIIQRVLSRSDRLWITLIADGIHVPWMALGNYIKVAGLERVIIVTDAISAAGLGPGVYKIADQEVIVDDHGATWSADRSHLAGSSATMPAMEGLLKQALQFTDEELKRLMYHNPRTAVFDAAH